MEIAIKIVIKTREYFEQSIRSQILEAIEYYIKDIETESTKMAV